MGYLQIIVVVLLSHLSDFKLLGPSTLKICSDSFIDSHSDTKHEVWKRI